MNEKEWELRRTRLHLRDDGEPKRPMTERRAQATKAAMKKQGHKNINAYECPYCGKWHVGHSR